MPPPRPYGQASGTGRLVAGIGADLWRGGASWASALMAKTTSAKSAKIAPIMIQLETIVVAREQCRRWLADVVWLVLWHAKAGAISGQKSRMVGGMLPIGRQKFQILIPYGHWLSAMSASGYNEGQRLSRGGGEKRPPRGGGSGAARRCRVK